MYLRGYAVIARTLGTNPLTVRATVHGFRINPPVNDFQRGMVDALLDAVGC